MQTSHHIPVILECCLLMSIHSLSRKQSLKDLNIAFIMETQTASILGNHKKFFSSLDCVKLLNLSIQISQFLLALVCSLRSSTVKRKAYLLPGLQHKIFLWAYCPNCLVHLVLVLTSSGYLTQVLQFPFDYGLEEIVFLGLFFVSEGSESEHSSFLNQL